MSFTSMQHTSAPERRRQWAVLASVAVIHAGVLYGLVVGLAGVVKLINPPPPLTAHDDPTTVPVKPPATRQQPHETHRRDIQQPTNAIAHQPDTTPLAIPSPDLGPIDDRALLQQLGDGDTHPVPTPSPAPHFTPRQARPRGTPGAWISPNDYPAQDLREGNSGVTGFNVVIGRDGHPQGCTIIASSGYPRLDAATCQAILRRATFTPATDDTGVAVAGDYQGKVHWTIPDH
jgi:protein TonB